MASNTADTTGYRDPERTREAARTREIERERDARDGRVAERPLDRTVERPVAQPAAQPVQPMGVAVPVAPYETVGDRVRWGPIWAGVLATFSIFMILEFLGVGLGLISPTNGNAGFTSGVSTLIAGLIAFFIGGWVAESAAAARGFGARLLDGFMVWALVSTLILTLSVLGLSSLFGALGSLAGQFMSAGHAVNIGSVNTAQAGNTSQLAGWGAFIWLVISAVAAMLGSSLGLPRRVAMWRRA